MAILSQPAFGPRASLTYITTGMLLDVWSVVWYYAFVRPEGAMTNNTWFWLVGMFLTGLTFVVIGVLLGPIGQAARRAELPPQGVVNAEAQIQQTAAQAPHPVVMPQATAMPAPTALPAPAPVTVPRNTAYPTAR